MSSKANKITSFFKPVPTPKRPEEDNVENIENSSLQSNLTPQKSSVKRKSEHIEDDGTIENSKKSPEQKNRCNENKVRAELLKLSKTLTILTPEIGSSWYQALSDSVFSKDWFQKLSEFVSKERDSATIYPSVTEVWSWTQHVPISSVKVVILGQDPYHGPGQAHGLCFSVKPGVAPPPSLLNMFKELERDIPGFSRPGHGHLAGWAAQGVLLLNACLTVRKSQANSHKDRGWEKVTDAVISWISKNLKGVVFLLWGAAAQKKAAMVDKQKHHLLTSVHPSPLSAHRGFLGCGHFSKCNQILEKQGSTPIDWANLPQKI